jgi:hypothetical protein
MRNPGLCVVIWIITAGLFPTASILQVCGDSCYIAFKFKTDEYVEPNSIKICTNTSQIPFGYQASIDMPVCDDTLCANVVLMFYWDLAGNYRRFDTIPGKPLTKFDHKKFMSSDYLKLDQILKNRNSILRNLKKEELVDKTVKIKAVTVDAVTGATQQTIKKSVVDGAVYSSFTLWHFVNGSIKDSMAAFTEGIYSELIARQMLLSDNYETQLFALRKWSNTDYELHSDLLFQVIRQGVPLIRAYTINKAPLPFSSIEKNRQFVSLFPVIDDYSKSIFLNRITSEENPAKVLLPLLNKEMIDFNEKQLEQIAAAFQKFEIPDFKEKKK